MSGTILLSKKNNPHTNNTWEPMGNLCCPEKLKKFY